MADLALIKKLRETTGCGIADCNKALAENGDDFEKSVDWLRKKGLSAAVKKGGRITSEGLVAVAIKGSDGVILEVNSETDFVARNQKFQDFVKALASVSFGCGSDVEKLKASNYPNSSIAVDEELKNQIGVIGENINIRRVDNLSVKNGSIVSYIHSAVAPNLGKIAVLVAIESAGDKAKLEELGKQIAMHIAAAKPDVLTIESVSADKLKREMEILKEKAKASGKPDNIIEKMMEGQVRKYYEEVVLLEQNFVMDDKVKIKDLLKNFSKEIGSETNISGFKLFILGEGIEKKENDFAAEVASMTKQ
ncbi:MAG: tsf [Rickettsiaceae bacterium]|jgi:elongation factor Ts|nr:tsf [Rickettsiaceae bacterium]